MEKSAKEMIDGLIGAGLILFGILFSLQVLAALWSMPLWATSGIFMVFLLLAAFL